MNRYTILSSDRTWSLGTVEAYDRDHALVLAENVFGEGIVKARIQLVDGNPHA